MTLWGERVEKNFPHVKFVLLPVSPPVFIRMWRKQGVEAVANLNCGPFWRPPFFYLAIFLPFLHIQTGPFTCVCMVVQCAWSMGAAVGRCTISCNRTCIIHCSSVGFCDKDGNMVSERNSYSFDTFKWPTAKAHSTRWWSHHLFLILFPTIFSSIIYFIKKLLIYYTLTFP